MDYTKAYHFLARLYGMVPYHLFGGYAFPPLHAFIEVTYRCNLRCKMCQFFQYAKEGDRKRPQEDELKAEEIKALLEGLPSYTLITFTGGELFVRPDMMDILAWSARGRRVTIISNGTMVDSARADSLVRLAPKSAFGKGLCLVDVSLEGTEGTHDGITGVKGSYAKTVGALARLSEARKRAGSRYPLLNMKTVITDRNLSELNILYDLARELDLDIFNPMIESNLDVHSMRMSGMHDIMPDKAPAMGKGLDTAALKAQLDEIDSKKKRHGRPQIRFTPPQMPAAEILRYYSRDLEIKDYACYSPWSVAAISAYGEIAVCPYFSQGSIREKSFRETWNGEAMRRFRRDIKTHKIYPGCMGCCNMTYIKRSK